MLPLQFTYIRARDGIAAPTHSNLTHEYIHVLISVLMGILLGELELISEVHALPESLPVEHRSVLWSALESVLKDRENICFTRTMEEHDVVFGRVELLISGLDI
jgi:hypothetical protein